MDERSEAEERDGGGGGGGGRRVVVDDAEEEAEDVGRNGLGALIRGGWGGGDFVEGGLDGAEGL